MKKLILTCHAITLLALLAGGFFSWQLVQQLNHATAAASETHQALDQALLSASEDSDIKGAGLSEKIALLSQHHEEANAAHDRLGTRAKAHHAKLEAVTHHVQSTHEKLAAMRAEIVRQEASLKRLRGSLAAVKGHYAGLAREWSEEVVRMIHVELPRQIELQRAQRADYQLARDTVTKLANELGTLGAHLIGQKRPGSRPLSPSWDAQPGRVIQISSEWGLVNLDRGLDAGLVPGVILVAFRGDEFIGKVRVVDVGDEAAVAEILPGFDWSSFQPGDLLLL